jgi:ribosome biogenesis GTPase
VRKPGMPQGLVIKSTGKNYDVLTELGTTIQCQVRGKIRLEGRSTTNPVAAGDIVDYTLENESEGNITFIHPRKNYIIRKSVNLSKEAQIIATNLDQAILVVTTTRPQTTPGFIDRFLITADAYDIQATLLFHKIDQYNEKERKEMEKRRKEMERRNTPRPYTFDGDRVNYHESKYSDLDLDGQSLGIQVQIVSDMPISNNNRRW